MQNVYQLEGPMGMGLGLKKTGTFTAFAAGTGILVYIDIVAHLILKVLSAKGGQNFFEAENEDVIDINNFKFVLHTSFASEREAIGLELINLLTDLCAKNGFEGLFEHHSRMSNSNSVDSKYWTGQFFDEEIAAAIQNNDSKVSICATPMIQEMFDKAADKISTNNELIHIS